MLCGVEEASVTTFSDDEAEEEGKEEEEEETVIDMDFFVGRPLQGEEEDPREPDNLRRDVEEVEAAAALLLMERWYFNNLRRASWRSFFRRSITAFFSK